MFSWSQTATTSSRRPSSNGYPANRTVVVGQTVQGSIRPPTYTRQQHLQSYLEDAVLKRSTRSSSHDAATHDTVFQTTDGNTLLLRVHVPLSSSSACPMMQLFGVDAKHPWLDNVMRVTGYQPISSESTWRNSGMLLGTAVHEVVKHFQLNPPDVMEFTDPGLRGIQTNPQIRRQSKQQQTSQQQLHQQRQDPPSWPTADNSNTSNSSPPGYKSVFEGPEIDMPHIPARIDNLNGLSREELDKLLEDQLEFMRYVHTLPTVEAIEKVGSSILDENVKLAEENLQLESRLQELHAQAKESKEKLQEKVTAFQELEKQQNAKCAPPDITKAMEDLKKAKDESYEESEALAEEWVEDGGNVDDFVKKYVAMRIVHHQRGAKLELLQQSSRSGF